MKTRSASGVQPAAVAYHEAGHAAAAWRLGIEFSEVTIVPAEDALGYVRRSGVVFRKQVRETLELGGSDRSRAWAQFRAERYAVYCFAGFAAQKRFDPRSARNSHARSDREAALEGLRFLYPPDEIRLHWRILKMRAEAFVRGHGVWDAVTALAEALIARKTLSGEEAREIMLHAFDRTTGFHAVKVPEANSGAAS